MKNADVTKRYIMVARLIRERLQAHLGNIERTHETLDKICLYRSLDPQLRAWDAEMRILELQMPSDYFVEKAMVVAQLGQAAD